MKSFMYHYVRRFSSEWPHSRHKDIFLFKKEILKIRKNNFFNISEAVNNFKKNEEFCNSIILTFDDGIKDHLKVAEILHSLSIKATFYIPIKPYIDRELLSVHKAHLIISKYGSSALDMLIELCNKLKINHYELVNKKEEEFFSFKISTTKR